MSELKATPGPYFACPTRVRLNGHTGLAKHLDGRWIINPVDDYERLPMAEVDCGDDECANTRKQAEYDAYFLAASWDLYEALEETHAALCFRDPEYLGSMRHKRNVADLKKAKGES